MPRKNSLAIYSPTFQLQRISPVSEALSELAEAPMKEKKGRHPVLMQMYFSHSLQQKKKHEQENIL